jgi:hypothetical protein
MSKTTTKMIKWFILLVSNRGTFWSKFLVEKIMICSSGHNEGEVNLKGIELSRQPKSDI